jgi:DNA-binding transcriptional ArsR family regulator
LPRVLARWLAARPLPKKCWTVVSDAPRLSNMSLGVEGSRDKAQLRALAHPLRLRMLSLLTSAPLTAAEVARELSLTHANASYHLRLLLAAGAIESAGEEHIRGGVAKRYRHPQFTKFPLLTDPEDRLAIASAMAVELRRRALSARTMPGSGHVADAELWVEPETWQEIVMAVREASVRLHAAAKPPRTLGAIRVNTTIAMFEMEPDK